MPLAKTAVLFLLAVYIIVRFFVVPSRLSGQLALDPSAFDGYVDPVTAREIALKWGPNVDLYDFSTQTASSHDAGDRGERLLLLMPLRNAEKEMQLMLTHLHDLTYPHQLIDIAFLVSDSTDNTYDELVLAMNSVQAGGSGFDDPEKRFNRIDIYRHDFGATIGQGVDQRHGVAVQAERRKLMGRARNWLLGTALRPYHSWVYWRDADIESSPPAIIEDLMSHDRDVIVPNVWRPLPKWLGGQQPYDLNSWQESDIALQLAQNLNEDDVIVEGYAEYPTYRVHLAYIRSDRGDLNEIIDLDGVGGVSILSKASVFRAGVNFPGFSFLNHAETEGFGKMARRMGYSVGGLVHYTVWHKYEPSDDDIEKMKQMQAEGLPID